LLNFRSIVDAELARLRPIEPRTPVAMIHVSAKILERGLDARLSQFKLAIVTERGLSVNYPDLLTLTRSMRTGLACGFPEWGSFRRKPLVAQGQTPEAI
jgi:hypothetical protein